MTKSNNKPNRIEQLGMSLFAYNFNPTQTEDGWEYESYYFNHIPNRDEIINEIVSRKYPNGGEFALQRKGIINPNDKEFLEYFERVEQIKRIVDDSY